MVTPAQLRELPSVHQILSVLSPAAARFPHSLVTGEIRRVLAEARARIATGEAAEWDIAGRVERSLLRLVEPSLRRVINATGVVLHTNLGRAPLGGAAPLAGYSNLEYDLATGKRGRRDDHTGGLLERLLGKPAIAVNNGAAAIYLALHELAAPGEVIVSRGELIEIGDGFRIPDIMQRAGVTLREVGTTNRTRISDYQDALNPATKAILRVHPSNFRITGFTAQPALSELVTLGQERAIPVIEDVGSGCVVDLRPHGIDEPLVQDSLATGVSVVSFSGDKLLGGPQAGLLAGDHDLVARMRRNPMFRALRLDKLITQSLEETLRALLFEDWERIPALRMIRLSAEEIRGRAERMATGLAGLRVDVEAGESVTGGGATPEQPLPTYLIAVGGDVRGFEAKLRLGNPPVIARIAGGRLLIDLRTVLPEEEPELVKRLSALA